MVTITRPTGTASFESQATPSTAAALRRTRDTRLEHPSPTWPSAVRVLMPFVVRQQIGDVSGLDVGPEGGTIDALADVERVIELSEFDDGAAFFSSQLDFGDGAVLFHGSAKTSVIDRIWQIEDGDFALSRRLVALVVRLSGRWRAV